MEDLTMKQETEQRRARVIMNDDGCDPREWDNMGTMFCKHRRYELGDKDAADPRDEDGKLREDIAVALPLYLYDHSGITMSTGRAYPFDCPWDAGQVGIIYVTREKLLKEYGGKRVTATMKQKAMKVLEQEVTTYDYFITGNCYGYILECGEECDHGDIHWEHVDSCFGFLGPLDESGIFDNVPAEWRELVVKAAEKPEYA
jgi:hypothetical protein